ncbi:YlmC/YmxH family sporulation protein [Fodinisporobacter ferrooxydans]|uniref:YlmC/YmxH family sporulation protein n=1 Tax=Fodinisporobacter ferrooxydans TaxID=2901836 RepID=A0ABY4CI96_9BACL|nr:YlmC/YmxH family sporulation protein [Alicyclobacillaceae bacterium MYW30-H2]
MMKASELQTKDVVSVGDGRKLGTVGDLDIDLETGMIRAIIVPGPTRFFGFLANGEDFVIPWHQIVRIGQDVVLVDMRNFQEINDNTFKQGNSSSGGF